MGVGRRQVLVGGLGLGLTATAGPHRALARTEMEGREGFSTYGIVPGGGEIDQTATLQHAVDEAARSGTPLFLPAGAYSTRRLDLKSGTQIEGVPGRTILRYRDGGAILSFDTVENLRLAGLVLNGEVRPLGEIGNIRKAGLFSEDAAGLEIAHNHVHDCGDNGILVWRLEPGEDGTIVTANRIERIAARSGGTGQNGNGINVFRAGSVLVNGNRIADCAFSAIRSNGGS